MYFIRFELWYLQQLPKPTKLRNISCWYRFGFAKLMYICWTRTWRFQLQKRNELTGNVGPSFIVQPSQPAKPASPVIVGRTVWTERSAGQFTRRQIRRNALFVVIFHWAPSNQHAKHACYILLSNSIGHNSVFSAGPICMYLYREATCLCRQDFILLLFVISRLDSRS